MTDIILYHDTVASSDIILRDTTTVTNFTVSGWESQPPIAPPVAKAQPGYSFVPFNTPQVSSIIGIPLNMGAAAPRITRVYYQARFEAPFNTPQLSVNFTNFGWYQALSTPAPVAKAQAGYAFVPFNTAQRSVNFTNFGWHGPTATAAPVVKAQPGYGFVPYNTAQLSVNFTNYGWHQALSTPSPVAKAQIGYAFVPFNTAQFVASDYRGTPIEFGGLLPHIRTVYAQAKFDTPYPFTTTPAVSTEDVGGDYSLIPLYRRKKLEDELYEIELKLRDISLDIPLPGHDFPVIYDRPLLEPFSDKQQTIKVLVSRRDLVQAEYQALLKRQQDDDDDDDDSAVLLLWP